MDNPKIEPTWVKGCIARIGYALDERDRPALARALIDLNSHVVPALIGVDRAYLADDVLAALAGAK